MCKMIRERAVAIILHLHKSSDLLVSFVKVDLFITNWKNTCSYVDNVNLAESRTAKPSTMYPRRQNFDLPH